MPVKYGKIRHKSAKSFDGTVTATVYGHHKTVNTVDGVSALYQAPGSSGSRKHFSGNRLSEV